MVLVGEDDFAVDLVGEDPQVVALSQPHQLPHQRLVVDLAGGVGGRAEQHQFRLFADQAFDLVEIGQEVVLGAEIVKDRLPVDDGNGHVVVGPAGVGQEHLVAGLEQGQEGTGHAHYRAGGDEDVLRAGGDAGAALKVPRRRRSPRIDAGIGHVFGVARIGKAAGGLDDMCRGIEIGLADL